MDRVLNFSYSAIDQQSILEAFKNKKPWSAPCINELKKRIFAFHFERQGQLCCYCRCDLHGHTRIDVDIEHILPKKRFKAHMFDIWNLSVACKRCNMSIKRQDTRFLVEHTYMVSRLQASEAYLFIHPNFDHSDDHLSRQAVQCDSKRLIKYVIKNDSAKGAFTYDYFRLKELEIDSFDAAQRHEPAEARSESLDRMRDLVSLAAEAVENPLADTRRWTTEIIAAWHSGAGHVTKADELVWQNGQVYLTARHPSTGEFLETGIWQHSSLKSCLGTARPSGENIVLEVCYSNDSISGITWTLTVNILDGTLAISSKLRRTSLGMRDLNQEFHSERVPALRAFLDAITSGWQPIGYIVTDVHADRSLRHLHPKAIAIDNCMGEADVAVLRKRCEKVIEAFEIAVEWGARFRFNVAFFMDELDVSMLRAAADALYDEVQRTPYQRHWTGKPLWDIDERRRMHLKFNGSALYMEPVFHALGCRSAGIFR